MTISTPVGKARFLFFLSQLQSILEKAESSENPAWFVYEENARTSIFMLEALARVYKKMGNTKKFKKLNVLFKSFEDRLGSIDYYDGFYKEFANEKKIPELITSYMYDKKNERTKALRDDLEKNKWMGKQKKQILKIIKKLDKTDWPDEKEDTRKILKIYQNYLDKITKKYRAGNILFTDLENDVHELRRELRWLSIYPQALLGLTQLTPATEPPELLKKYLTPEVINSRFNVMPDGSGLQGHIMLNRNYFYALSWMIDALGKLKDSGLRINVIEESLRSVYKVSSNAEQLAYSFCNEDQMPIPQILNQSQKIAQIFFDENITENLITK